MASSSRSMHPSSRSRSRSGRADPHRRPRAARPSLGETALAVDVEGGLGDRVSSAMELAVALPRLGDAATRRPQSRRAHCRDRRGGRDRSIRPSTASRRALDAACRAGDVQAALLAQPAVAALIAVAVLVPVLRAAELPERRARPATRRPGRRAPGRAPRCDQLATCRTRSDRRRSGLAWLRSSGLARQLRTKPDELAANLASWGRWKATSARGSTRPRNSARRALTSLSRSLSRAATGNPDANRDGAPRRPPGPGEAGRQARRDDRRPAARPRTPAGRDAGDGPGARTAPPQRPSARPPRASRRVTRLAPVRRSIGWARR